MTDALRQTSSQTLGRALLVPGPQPPLSHLGATLMRHVVGTVVRYSLYQLGLPMPESPPVRILRLRVLLDSAPLEAVLAGDPAGEEIVAALLRPGGAGELPAAAGRVRAAAALHRARLATLGLRRGRIQPSDAQASETQSAARDPGPRRSREELWAAICSTVAGRMPYLCDAALGELVTSLARRRLRLAGKPMEGALGPVAWQIHHGRDGDLRALGPLDPLVPSWAEAVLSQEELRSRAERARRGARLPARSGRRGAFREAYRWVVSEVRPLLLELGARAQEEGLVSAADDVFFIPFDLGVELAAAHRPSWLAAAVATNRREHQALGAEPEHAPEIEGPPALAPLSQRSTEWDLAPLLLVE